MLSSSSKCGLLAAACLFSLGLSDANAQSGTRSGGYSGGYNTRSRQKPVQKKRMSETSMGKMKDKAMQDKGMADKGMADKPMANKPLMVKLGLEGYCPVCILDAHKWEKGRQEHRSVYDGVAYLFPSAAVKKKFDMTPAKYVPALNGDCIVCYEKYDKRVPGNIRYAAKRNGRIYMFPSDEVKQTWIENPAAYDKSDVALNGECSVCLVAANKHVPGMEKFTEVHGGLRYLFPSAKEQDVFRQSPGKYAKAEMMYTKASMMKDDKGMMKDKAGSSSKGMMKDKAGSSSKDMMKGKAGSSSKGT